MRACVPDLFANLKVHVVKLFWCRTAVEASSLPVSWLKVPWVQSGIACWPRATRASALVRCFMAHGWFMVSAQLGVLGG
jgi:hypothetical protein